MSFSDLAGTIKLSGVQSEKEMRRNKYKRTDEKTRSELIGGIESFKEANQSIEHVQAESAASLDNTLRMAQVFSL